MPSLPPPVWAELHYGGAWHDVTEDVRVRTSPVTVTRGLSSESSSAAEPTSCTCDLDSRDDRYAPRNPMSPLWGLIGRNTPFRWGYTIGSPWGQMPGGLTWNALFVNNTDALDVTGDLDLRVDVALEDWSESQMIALRYVPSSNNDSWVLEMVDGVPTLFWSTTGTYAGRTVQQATEPVKAYNGQRLALRVTLDIDNGSGGYEVRFYTGRTVDDNEWSLLGSPIVGVGTTSIYPGTGYMEFGAGFDFNALPSGGALNCMRGKAYALKLLDSGTVKVDMKTAAAAMSGGTTFVDATGLTWHVGGNVVLTNRHIRMCGEVPAWPPTRDLSGNDNYVSIAPAGVTRRMDAGNKPQDSAIRRFIHASDPLECWPLTDGVDSKTAKSMLGGPDMVLERGPLSVPPTWMGGSLADWCEPVLAARPDTVGGLIGATPRVASVGASWSVDLFLSGGGPAASTRFIVYDAGAGTAVDNQVSLDGILTGDLDQLTLIRNSEAFDDEDAGSAELLANISPIGVFDDRPHHLRVTVTPGATSGWSVYIDGALRASGSITGIRVKPVSRILLGWGHIDGLTGSDRAFGYLTYWDDAGPTAAEIWNAFMGFQGERAGDRIERLATEAGYTASIAGALTHQQPMGIQGQAKLLDLLNEAATTNFGYVLDARDRTEVIHRGGSTLWNQPPALVLDYSAGVIGAPFRPVDDDKLTENDVSVKRAYGSVPARQVLETGDLSVQDPPNGVGRYDKEYTYSLATDAQAVQVAAMRLHLGTYAGVRYTRITLNLANERVFQMIDDILRIDVGDTIRLTDLPADHGPDPVDVLVLGYQETAGPDEWSVTFNCAPAEPWTAGVIGSTQYGRLDTDGSKLTSAVTASATTVPVTTTSGARWVDSATYPGEFPFDVRTGGEVMRVTGISGTSTAQTFTVVRAVNGISKEHPAGQDIRLAAPVYVAL